MTKRRAPLSIDAALARIAGQLTGGWEAMAQIADRKERTVRNWGDPDTPEDIPLPKAIALDLAYQAAGGEGSPLFESYAFQLELAEVTRFADRIALGRKAAAAMKEGGEAHAALILAAQPGATIADRMSARREVLESIDALKQLVPYLDPVEPLQAFPDNRTHVEGEQPPGPP